MTVQERADRIYEGLLVAQPRRPEIGWVELSEVLPEFERLGSWKLRSAFIDEIAEVRDSRFEITASESVRLTRARPWPLQIGSKALLWVVVALYRLSQTSVEGATIELVARETGLAHTTTAQYLSSLCGSFAERDATGRYRLLVAADREIWIDLRSKRHPTAGEVVTLEGEARKSLKASEKPPVLVRPDTDQVRRALELNDRMRDFHRQGIAFHSNGLEEAGKQDEYLRGLLASLEADKEG